jgi:hypothetical protein
LSNENATCGRLSKERNVAVPTLRWRGIKYNGIMSLDTQELAKQVRSHHSILTWLSVTIQELPDRVSSIETSFDTATFGKPKGVSEGEGNMRSLLPKPSFVTC